MALLSRDCPKKLESVEAIEIAALKAEFVPGLTDFSWYKTGRYISNDQKMY
jgi:hypothetical protein